ncbi:MAG: efflux RND transporter periplasmic adaptor subunit [Thermoanaerobaculia bacterium]
MQRFTSFRTAGLRLVPLLAAFLLLSACGQEDAANAHPPVQPPQVGFRILHPQTVTLTTQLPGRTVAFRMAEVRPQVDGIIRERLFEEGATVEAGQGLYQIDPATYQAEVKAAEAELARARASLQRSIAQADRYRELLTRKVVSQQEYDEVFAAQAENEADVAAAQARLERARINLNYTMVTAPIGGRIGRSNITEGALVTANQETVLAIITQLDPIYVDLTQSSAELLRTRRAIETGEIIVSDKGEAPVELMIDATGARYSHQGRAQFSEVLVEETTGTITLRAVFPNPEHELMPGLFVRGIVSQGEVKNAFKVPQAAVVRGNDGQAFVWLIGPDDMVKRQPVTVRRAIDDTWLVTEGLSSGDRVVVDGLQRVQPDSKVTPVAVEQPDTPNATRQTEASS